MCTSLTNFIRLHRMLIFSRCCGKDGWLIVCMFILLILLLSSLTCGCDSSLYWYSWTRLWRASRYRVQSAMTGHSRGRRVTSRPVVRTACVVSCTIDAVDTTSTATADASSVSPACWQWLESWRCCPLPPTTGTSRSFVILYGRRFRRHALATQHHPQLSTTWSVSGAHIARVYILEWKHAHHGLQLLVRSNVVIFHTS